MDPFVIIGRVCLTVALATVMSVLFIMAGFMIHIISGVSLNEYMDSPNTLRLFFLYLLVGVGIVGYFKVMRGVLDVLLEILYTGKIERK